ncbi:diguanylate cyclase/phosphodiesterase (GGDEF & EAL domains) with PAS/PAC sensor(s), partial [hydrothermal vent metagenome]
MATKSGSKGKGSRKAVLGIVGGTTLTLAGERLFHGKRKILALISYMVLSPQENVSREFLAGLLWSDVSDTQAGDSLRQLFVELRRVFRQSDFPLLTIYKDTVTTNRELVETDIDVIFQHLSEGKVTKLLASKASLSADILYGFDDLSSNFSQWLFDFRAAFHDRLMRGLQDGYQSEKFSATSRQQMAEIAIGLDAVHEESHRFAMHLAASNGDIGTALQVYKKLYDALDEELGMEPSAKTQALVVKIKTGYFDGTHSFESPGPGIISKSTAHAHPLAPGIPTVAVLPFTTLGPDPVPRYFSMGILEDTVCQLATLREPRVISSNSTRNIDGNESDANAKLIAMGANYFVCGSINKSGDNYHLSVQLSDIKSGIVEWAKVYDTTGDKLFEVQNEIARSISQKLVPSLRLAELRRTDSSRAENLTAYHLTLRGRDLAFRLERDTYDEAGDLLRLACQKDPRFAPTFVALADWYSVKLGQGWSLDAAQDQMLLEK